MLQQHGSQNVVLLRRLPLLRLNAWTTASNQLMRKARVVAVDLFHAQSEELLFLAVGARGRKVLVDSFFDLWEANVVSDFSTAKHQSNIFTSLGHKQCTTATS